MPSTQPQSQPWQAALKYISQCPSCGAKYTPEQARLLTKQGTANMVHITCTDCRGYFVAMIVQMGSGLSSVGTITDLSFEDMARLRAATPITLDETIDAHQYINKNF